MEFQEFIDEIKEALTSRFSESMPGTTIEQQEVKKLEGNSYTALSVRPAGNFIGVNLDMEHLYEGLENDVSFDELVQYAEDRVFAGLEKTPFFKLDQMPDYETAKNQLVAELAGMTADPYLLAHIPHKNIEDMTMVYRLQIAKFDDNTATILVTNSLMQQWGVTAEQLHQDAMESSAKLRPFQIRTMAQIMEEIFGGEPGGSFMLPDDAAPSMYIVTNEDRVRGSAALFYPEMTDVCARMLKGDYYILPSSTHELILLPDNGEIRSSELTGIVGSVNDTSVPDEEKLSDHAYHYDAAGRIFERADKYEMRMQEKEKQGNERHSVLDDLKRNKEQAAAKSAPAKSRRQKEEQSL